MESGVGVMWWNESARGRRRKKERLREKRERERERHVEYFMQRK